MIFFEGSKVGLFSIFRNDLSSASFERREVIEAEECLVSSGCLIDMVLSSGCLIDMVVFSRCLIDMNRR